MRSLLFTLVTLGCATAVFAADDKEKERVTAREALKARILAENAKKQGTAAPAPAAKPGETPAATEPVSPLVKTAETPPPTPAKEQKPAPSPAEKAKAEPATVLPQVQVNRGRINTNPLDGQIIEQEKEIAREKAAAKPTELDKALNSPKVSKALSIFGGESSSQRATVANERVKIMQEERDLLEAMKAAKTKEEKAELQKELDQLRAYRRELEKGLR